MAGGVSINARAGTPTLSRSASRGGASQRRSRDRPPAAANLGAESYYGSPVGEDGDLYGSGLGVGRVDMMHLFTALCMFCRGSLLVRTRVCFQLFDDDFNGTMDMAEMRVFLTNATRTLHVLDLYPALPKPAEIRRLADMMFSQADSDGDGCVSPDEFYEWARRRTAPTKPLMQRFRKARMWPHCVCGVVLANAHARTPRGHSCCSPTVLTDGASRSFACAGWVGVLVVYGCVGVVTRRPRRLWPK